MQKELNDNYFVAFKTLCNTLESEFKLANASKLALALCDHEIYNLTDEMKKIILYIQDNVIDFDKYEFSIAHILKHERIETLKEKKELYEYYVPQSKEKKKADFHCFMIDKSKIAEYEKVLEEYMFSSDEIFLIISTLVDMVAKNPEEISQTLKSLMIFEMSHKLYKQFVIQNAFYLFRDFSQDLDACFSELIKKYNNKENAFSELCEHPEIMTNYE